MTLKIDGSYGEGGGQILRTALALSVATQQPVEIYNIRANRKPPGLKPQHLGVVKILKKLSDAEVEGAYIGSTWLRFEPKRLRYASLEIDLKTAASIPLIIQALAILAPVIEKPLHIKLTGGTDVKHSPSIDYMKYVFREALEALGLKVGIQVLRRGFYPRGGGIVELRMEPGSIVKHFEFKTPELRDSKVGLIAVASKDLRSRNVASRIFNAALSVLTRRNLVPSFTRVEYTDTLSTGAVATVFLNAPRSFIGIDRLGEKGLPSEKLGKELAQRFLEELKSGAAVDEHLADMLVPFGFFMNNLRFRTSRLTQHLLTNLWVASQFFQDHEYWISENNKTVEIRKA
jgi:RNA 3'-phosphate cyclase